MLSGSISSGTREHRADDVDVGVHRHTEGRGEKSHAGNDYRGDGRCKSRRNALALVMPAEALGFVSCGHEYRVVHRCAELYRADADRCDEGQRLTEVVGKSEVYEYCKLNDRYEYEGQ